MPLKLPPIAITPPTYQQLPARDRVRFRYRTDRRKSDAFGRRLDRYTRLAERSSADAEIASDRARLAGLRDRTNRGEASHGAEVEAIALEQRIAKREASLPDLREDDPEWSEDWAVDEQARMLDIVMVDIVCGGEHTTWPADHAAQVEIVESLPQSAVNEALFLIRAERYDSDPLGK